MLIPGRTEKRGKEGRASLTLAVASSRAAGFAALIPFVAKSPPKVLVLKGMVEINMEMEK